MIYYLFGPDTYRSKQMLKNLITEHKALDITEELDLVSQKIKIEVLKNKLLSNTLFSNKRFIVVSGLSDKGSHIKDKEELTATIKDLKFPKEDVLVFYESNADKRTTLHKTLRSISDEMYEFGHLNPEEMEVWLRKQATDIDLKLNHENRKKLAAMLGSDTWQASQELAKLKSYCGDREVVYDDIDLLVRAKLDDDIFKLTDHIAKGEKQQSIKLLHDQLEIGSDELYLLAMITRQFRILIQIKSVIATKPEADNYAISKILNLHPFVIQKSSLMVKRYNIGQLKQIYSKLEKLDLDLKTSKVSGQVLLEKFVMSV